MKPVHIFNCTSFKLICPPSTSPNGLFHSNFQTESLYTNKEFATVFMITSRLPAGAKFIFFGTISGQVPVGTKRFFKWDENSRSVQVTTHLHLLPILVYFNSNLIKYIHTCENIRRLYTHMHVWTHVHECTHTLIRWIPCVYSHQLCQPPFRSCNISYIEILKFLILLFSY
jgi:hypothetical protein